MPNHTLKGRAGNLISAGDFSHKYTMTVTDIAGKKSEPFDVALLLAPNLSLLPGDYVEVSGVFSFPIDTSNYMAEKQLWNQGMIAEFRAFRIKKNPPDKYTIFVRMRQGFDSAL